MNRLLPTLFAASSWRDISAYIDEVFIPRISATSAGVKLLLSIKYLSLGSNILKRYPPCKAKHLEKLAGNECFVLVSDYGLDDYVYNQHY